MRLYLFPMFFLVLLVPGVFASEYGFEDEVAHLLSYIELSDCTFIRNGKAYSSAEARAHIGKKYDYIKGKISSAEQFITYGASKSSITGKQYLVDCDGAAMPSGQWLRDELAAFRNDSTSGRLDKK